MHDRCFHRWLLSKSALLPWTFPPMSVQLFWLLVTNCSFDCHCFCLTAAAAYHGCIIYVYSVDCIVGMNFPSISLPMMLFKATPNRINMQSANEMGCFGICYNNGIFAPHTTHDELMAFQIAIKLHIGRRCIIVTSAPLQKKVATSRSFSTSHLK